MLKYEPLFPDGSILNCYEATCISPSESVFFFFFFFRKLSTDIHKFIGRDLLGTSFASGFRTVFEAYVTYQHITLNDLYWQDFFKNKIE